MAADAALFDAAFLAGQLAFGEDVAQAARAWFAPISVLAPWSVATRPMIATASRHGLRSKAACEAGQLMEFGRLMHQCRNNKRRRSGNM